MSALTCRALSAGYDDVPVVRDLDLTISPGEVVALLGPNGAGKTATLLTVSGILKPIRGSILLFDESIGGLAPERIARRGVAHVPDDRALFLDLSVGDNLTLCARPGDTSIDKILSMFPALENRWHVPAKQLSGGEQQMLAMGRALAQNPKVLIVDEMSMGLAPTVVESLLPVLRQVADERGVAVLVVEQYVAAALSMADRVYVLNHGEMVLTDSAARIRADPHLLEDAYLGARDR